MRETQEIDKGLISGLGTSPVGGHGNPLQYSCLRNTGWLYSPWGHKRVGHNLAIKQQQQIHKYVCCCCCVTSVMSDSVRPHRRQPTRLLHPWDSPGKNTGVGCHFLLQCMKVKSEGEVAQLCPTLCDPIDSSPPGSSIPGILQARVLEGVAISFSNA